MSCGLHQFFGLIFPRTCRNKRLAVLVLALTCLEVLCPPAGAQPPGRRVISGASRLALSRTGIHTHADFILFDTGELDLAALQKDPARYPALKVTAHCRLSTDHAALPPELAAPGDPPLPNPYGPIDGGTGKPGWGIVPFNKNGRHQAKVLVPTRFANWLALQPPARRKVYLDPRRYWLEVRWGVPSTLYPAGTSP